MWVILLAVGALCTMMLVTYVQRRRTGHKLTVRDRFLNSMTPAMIGAGLGFAYARYTIDAEALATSKLPGMYACMGAVIAILALRGAALLRLMFVDFFGSKE